MAIRTLPGFPESQTCLEYMVGAAHKKFMYPGIQQCISLTGFNVAGLLGAHISPGSSKLDIDAILRALRSGGGENYPDWYIVGQFQEHFKYSKVKWNSLDKIVNDLRKQLGKKANFYAFDTGDIVKRQKWSWGIDIQAEHTPFEAKFSYAKAGGARTKAFTPITGGLIKM